MIREDEEELIEDDDLIDDDGDHGSQLQVPRPKKPVVSHKKITVYTNTQNEMDELEAELQKIKPDKKFVKKAMGTTFTQRRWWIQEECPSVQQILLKYPVFKKSKYVSVASYYITQYSFVHLATVCNCMYMYTYTCSYIQ